MQSDLEFGLSVGATQSLDEARHVLVRKDEECFSHQIEGLTNDSDLPHAIEAEKGLTGGLQKSKDQKWQWLRSGRKPSSAAWYLVLMLGDVMLLIMVLVTVVVLISSLHLTFQVSSDVFSIKTAKLIWICLALVSWGLAVKITQAQKLDFASSRFKSPCCTLFALALMGIFSIVLSSLLLSIGFITSAWLEMFFLAIAVPVFTTWRILLAQIVNLPRFRPRVVIIGVNPAGETIAKELLSAKHPGANILGYIGENTEERSSRNGLPVLGGRSALHYLVYNGLIDMIIIALDYGAKPELFKEAVEAVQFGTAVLPMTVAYENSTGKIPVEHVGDQWYVALQSERILSPLYLYWKKVLDLVCGFCGLVVLCLMLPVIALLISLDSPGPIFYRQERVGLRGKPFRIYKFRSMRTDAEHNGSAIWATENDARVTRVGRYMRVFHLDEFPQVLNILRGDMSLIGPRPEREEFVVELEKTIRFYRCRLAVKPGLTGWAQVKYHYANSDNDTLIKLQYDLYYIKHQSFMLDIFIILKTVAEVFLHRGT